MVLCDYGRLSVLLCYLASEIHQFKERGSLYFNIFIDFDMAITIYVYYSTEITPPPSNDQPHVTQKSSLNLSTLPTHGVQFQLLPLPLLEI